MKKILVTGGAGFIGSEFVRQQIKKGQDIVVVDKLTYAGSLERLKDFKNQYAFYQDDICDEKAINKIFDQERPGVVIHFAAESHVDRSIQAPDDFIRTNVVGTRILLDVAKEYDVERFIHISTDEVYGSLGEGDAPFTEQSSLAPNSPYSASKAGSDCLVRSYFKTYQFPAIITRCSNNYGPHQFLEKLIPLMITNALGNKPLPVYGNGGNIRDWIYVGDHCSAIDMIVHDGKSGEIYNVGGNNEWGNIHLVHKICDILDEVAPRFGLSSYKDLIVFVDDRLGHDWRYAIDSNKIRRDLGWMPKADFESEIRKTIQWYRKH